MVRGIKTKEVENKEEGEERKEMKYEEIIWAEKYRPNDFNAVVGQEEIVRRLKAFVEQKNMPHLLFVGSAGTGKTTLALIIVKKLFGKNWRENYLELNASDERGINVIRQKVKDFARTKAIGNVPFKIVFLDEADALTREAQQALRRTMENFTMTCRFILSCNYSSKIIDPIQSRTSIFRFRSFTFNDLKKIIERIAKNEKIKISDNTIKAIFELSGGDARRAINLLQTASSISKDINEETIYETTAQAKPKEVLEIISDALNGNFIGARAKLMNILIQQGVYALDLIKSIQKEIVDLNIPQEKKVKLLERIAETEFRIAEGADELIQLEGLLAFIIAISK